jgi:outer membrane biosynthesis protein TonB
MLPPNGEVNATLYEQVLDFARKEIEDASGQMEELRRALHLVESRVEAAKSVYESVAARLNLEDELEDEARLDTAFNPAIRSGAPPPARAAEAPPVTAYQEPVAQRPVVPAQPPPVFVPEPPVAATPTFQPQPQPTSTPPPAPAQKSAAAEVPPPAYQPERVRKSDEAPHVQPEPAAANGNGTSDGFSMDLIRKHLEARERAAQSASQAPTKRPEPAPQRPAAPPVQAQAPPPPAPATEAPAAAQPAQSGFPGLSEADRALIGEYLRSKRD